jgi:hypothetical protein
MFRVLLIAFFVSIGLGSFAATTPSTVEPKATTTTVEQQKKYLSTLTTWQVETMLQRKLTFKEKVSWWFAKQKLKLSIDDGDKRKANNKAVWGFALGIAGLLIFPLFAIPGLILSNQALSMEREQKGLLNSTNDDLALVGKILSIVGIVLLILVAAFIALVLSVGWG